MDTHEDVQRKGLHVTTHDTPDPTGAVTSPQGPPSGVDPQEWETQLHTLLARFAPHVEAAEDVVRDAENRVQVARDNLEEARRAAASRVYQSDRLVFMRASVDEEADGLTRKTTAKKVKVAYRYLLARAVELAQGEVQGYRDDLAAAEYESTRSVAACLEAQRLAAERLEAARAMHTRVLAAQATAREGLAVMLQKIAGSDES